MPRIPQKPKLVNRGPAGLLTKLDRDGAEGTGGSGAGKDESDFSPDRKKALDLKTMDKIEPALIRMAVPISTLVSDPKNARLHPERNLGAIMLSLAKYGQVKPVVTRKATNVVVAGNGTMEAAQELGWTKLAAVFVDMDDVAAAGYGLADNRTAELARWDFEVFAAIDRILQEHDQPTIGWTIDELEVLRIAEWTPPNIEEGNGFDGAGEKDKPLLMSFTPDQYAVIEEAIALYRETKEKFGKGKARKDYEPVDYLILLCREWVDATQEEEDMKNHA